jgi:hypothetical protein
LKDYERFGGCQIEVEKVFGKLKFEPLGNNILWLNSFDLTFESFMHNMSSKQIE